MEFGVWGGKWNWTDMFRGSALSLSSAVMGEEDIHLDRIRGRYVQAAARCPVLEMSLRRKANLCPRRRAEGELRQVSCS